MIKNIAKATIIAATMFQLIGCTENPMMDVIEDVAEAVIEAKADEVRNQPQLIEVPEELEALVYEIVDEESRYLEEVYGVDLSMVDVLFNLNDRPAVGRATYINKDNKFVQLDPFYIRGIGNDYLRVLIFHELAHLTASSVGGLKQLAVNPHNLTWQTIMVERGFSPDDGHTEEVLIDGHR